MTHLIAGLLPFCTAAVQQQASESSAQDCVLEAVERPSANATFFLEPLATLILFDAKLFEPSGDVHFSVTNNQHALLCHACFFNIFLLTLSHHDTMVW